MSALSRLAETVFIVALACSTAIGGSIERESWDTSVRDTASREIFPRPEPKMHMVARYNEFDPVWYLMNNPDVAAVGTTRAWALYHYSHAGVNELRSPNMMFDPKFYQAQYPDLKQFSGTELMEHWSSRGILEGRRGSQHFDVSFYLRANGDLKQAYGNDYARAHDHFVAQGFRENRFTTEDTIFMTHDLLRPLSPIMPVNLVDQSCLSGFCVRNPDPGRFQPGAPVDVEALLKLVLPSVGARVVCVPILYMNPTAGVICSVVVRAVLAPPIANAPGSSHYTRDFDRSDRPTRGGGGGSVERPCDSGEHGRVCEGGEGLRIK